MKSLKKMELASDMVIGPIKSMKNNQKERFILLPHALCVLSFIVACMTCCSCIPNKGVFTVLLYPLVVPAESIYWAARELFWGEDKEYILTEMKGLKMFEHLGQYRGRFIALYFCSFLHKDILDSLSQSLKVVTERGYSEKFRLETIQSTVISMNNSVRRVTREKLHSTDQRIGTRKIGGKRSCFYQDILIYPHSVVAR